MQDDAKTNGLDPASSRLLEPEGPQPVVGRSLFDEAEQLMAESHDAELVKRSLMSRGLNEESARVLVNSLPTGAMPSSLPEPSMSLSTHAMVPDLFSLTELGLHGDPALVGLYWLAFSGVFLLVLLLVVLVPLPELFGEAGPSEGFLVFIEDVAPPVGLSIALIAFLRGLFLVTRGRRLSISRRKR
jgi:hypothetical protein